MIFVFLRRPRLAGMRQVVFCQVLSGPRHYHFVSPDGGGRLALSGGEAIMRPEWVKAVGGPAMVNAMNRAAAHGDRIPGGDAGYAAFAPGGIWDPVKSTVERARPLPLIGSPARPTQCPQYSPIRSEPSRLSSRFRFTSFSIRGAVTVRNHSSTPERRAWTKPLTRSATGLKITCLWSADSVVESALLVPPPATS